MVPNKKTNVVWIMNFNSITFNFYISNSKAMFILQIPVIKITNISPCWHKKSKNQLFPLVKKLGKWDVFDTEWGRCQSCIPCRQLAYSQKQNYWEKTHSRHKNVESSQNRLLCLIFTPQITSLSFGISELIIP